METKPLDLTLVVPCYNEGPHLRENVVIIRDVLSNTHYRFELLFVDDKSQDDTVDHIKDICSRYPDCRYILHEKNRGRGAAFKTGFANAKGRVVGFIDVDLEVHPLSVPYLVSLLDNDSYDVVTGLRYYDTSQIGSLPREILSRIYRLFVRMMLGAPLRDTETGYKFFNAARSRSVVLGSQSNGWFWDTEVMARAWLKGLRVLEFPVLFLRNPGKKSTVRLLPDIAAYMKELLAFRPKVGLSYWKKSPVFWSAAGYDFILKLLLGKEYGRIFSEAAALIPENSSVVDVCCGTGRLYLDFLRGKKGSYLGLDFNSHFIISLRKKGVNAEFFNLLEEEVPPADIVVFCSSLMQFPSMREEVFQKLFAAARQALIISEPVKNISQHPIKWIGNLANRMADPGVGEFRRHFTPQEFADFAERHKASSIIIKPGNPIALAVFKKK